jgi:hypothetical protein
MKISLTNPTKNIIPKNALNSTAYHRLEVEGWKPNRYKNLNANS